MRRTFALAAAAALIVAVATVASATPQQGLARFGTNQWGSHLNCDYNSPTCAEVYQYIGPNGYYTGHDEPAVEFYSNQKGAGYNMTYQLTLPKDPPQLPTQDGTGGTWNFQLHPAFWFGMAVCDTQSAPEYTTQCKADSDVNIFNSANPSSPKYIGRHPGTAFMEMQFYPPGWVDWPSGDSCGATQWCAALNIDSYSQNMNTGAENNASCLDTVGIEPVNFAFITKSGVAQAPANPVDATLATYTPDPTKDLFMNSGDTLSVHLFDTSNGLKIAIDDVTSGQSGSMTASAANQFGQVVFDPTASQCSVNLYNFHPMYATSSPETRVPWAAHSYNIAYSDEIGHFEYCSVVSDGDCLSGVSDPEGSDSDDNACFSPSDSSLIQIGGCLGTDVDFDGPNYGMNWPGTLKSPVKDAQLHPTPILFSSPLFMSGGKATNYSQIAFEADLPRIEGFTTPPCQRHLLNPTDPSPGAGCTNPPLGSTFYPFFSTTMQNGMCVWQEGGPYLPNTLNNFGGSSAAEFGTKASGNLLALTYPAAGFTVQKVYEDFRNVLPRNPCPASTG